MVEVKREGIQDSDWRCGLIEVECGDGVGILMLMPMLTVMLMPMLTDMALQKDHGRT